MQYLYYDLEREKNIKIWEQRIWSASTHCSDVEL